MWPAVAGVVRPVNEPFTVTAPDTVSSVTVALPAAVLLLGGTSWPPWRISSYWIVAAPAQTVMPRRKQNDQ